MDSQRGNDTQHGGTQHGGTRPDVDLRQGYTTQHNRTGHYNAHQPYDVRPCHNGPQHYVALPIYHYMPPLPPIGTSHPGYHNMPVNSQPQWWQQDYGQPGIPNFHEQSQPNPYQGIRNGTAYPGRTHLQKAPVILGSIEQSWASGGRHTIKIDRRGDGRTINFFGKVPGLVHTWAGFVDNPQSLLELYNSRSGGVVSIIMASSRRGATRDTTIDWNVLRPTVPQPLLSNGNGPSTNEDSENLQATNTSVSMLRVNSIGLESIQYKEGYNAGARDIRVRSDSQRGLNILAKVDGLANTWAGTVGSPSTLMEMWNQKPPNTTANVIMAFEHNGPKTSTEMSWNVLLPPKQVSSSPYPRLSTPAPFDDTYQTVPIFIPFWDIHYGNQ
jgi:hypothetical protein